MKKTSLMLVMVGLLASTSFGTIVFSDDFSGNLSQWSTTGGSGEPAIVNGTLNMVASYPGEPWHTEAISTQTWSNPGTYELQFDACTDLREGSHENRLENIRATMPGGLELRWKGWGNGVNIYFKGVNIGSVGNTFQGWDTYKLVLDGRTAQVYRNGNLGFNQVMTSDPDFATYGAIDLWTKFTVYGASYDNIQLNYVPEPATMALLGLGGLLLRRRK